MNEIEALKYAEERLSTISYQLECQSILPCRSFYEKQQGMLVQAVIALRSEQEREKGCEYCDNDYYMEDTDLHGLDKIKNRFCPFCGRKLEVDK